MKQGKITKKAVAAIIGCLMLITSFPAFGSKVYAAELPSDKQFATKADLMNFNTNDKDGAINPAKVYFGNNKQMWWIAGSQNGNLTLFAESPLLRNLQYEPDHRNKSYSDDWKCTYLNGAPTEVYSNHYGASPLRNTLQGLESSYFTSKEQALMNNTTIYTYDAKNGSVYYTTNKLYLAYGDGDKEYTYITVGKNSPTALNNGLRIHKSYWGNYGKFWLRAPHSSYKNAVWAPVPGSVIFTGPVDTEYYPLMPAFELNLSSVIFASSALAATSSGTLNHSSAMTLRYDTNQLGSATVFHAKNEVQLTDVPNGTYLVAQNSTEAYAKQITNETKVTASDMGLDSFYNCKVWLETTDSNQRMTYATLADEIYSINVTLSNGMKVTTGNLTQEIGQNIPMGNIVITAEDGYMFPADYTVVAQNGITVKRDNEHQLTIAGTPTNNVNLTLPPATLKVYNMSLTGQGIFGITCKDYSPIEKKELTITNSGNVQLVNVNVSITGKDADAFELKGDDVTVIQPNGTLQVTVNPKNNLDINDYQATLFVSADKVTDQTIDLRFTVNEHDYKEVVTLPTCTDKGYTTYACKNCTHSYVSNEVNAKGHAFGEWEVTTKPTTTSTGTKERTCERCNHKETEVIPMISTTNKPDDENKKPDSNDNIQTGDDSNLTLWLTLLALSAAGAGGTCVYSRRRRSSRAK
ncbi:MAG: hypothetical protein Q4C46_07685 [Bacillota bacterium]|nr:hypothetical protein [Bacillota bacterium]